MTAGRFAGKVALVTGGSSGIGQRVAELLAAEGARVAVVASSSLAKAEAVAAAIGEAGGEAKGFVTDVREATACERLVADVERAFGGIDLLVNAAGVFYGTPVAATAPTDAAQLLDINIAGPWNVASAVVPSMRRRGGGRIVNLSSVAGVVGVKGLALYCASKAAVAMMTRVMGAELAAEGIAVNAVAPGNTATPMNAAVRADTAMVDAMRAMTPGPDVFSDVSDMAGIILFLLSEAARPVYGATWLADEGFAAAVG
jgi:3-oxoacyl-[acyl-carrier protein] reductase